ncbi:MAG TPA: MBL fold metallo-hydrolase [Candidatus Dormibacteraeota bacterium]|nr:MBL fold metallo-hydrolase [Candidatus Dormibacteraeota bacterium]
MRVPYEVRYRRGVHLPVLDLWIDARNGRDLAVVSHAHGDHIARHRRALCTEATRRVLALRTGIGRRGRRAITEEAPGPGLAYGEELELRDAVLSLHPAGHVLGSSQVLVRHRGVRVLYSGDIKLRDGRTAEPLEHVECDVLVVEATFGRPEYRFPPTDQVARAICDFCLDSVAAGVTPVLYAYSLGKGQEVLSHLAGAGLPVVLCGSLHTVTEIYRAMGVALPDAERGGDTLPRNAVVICPPHLRGKPWVRRITPRRTAYISGWAVERGAACRLGCDAAFALSDHADFDELLRYVERSAAQQVYTLFGFAEDLARQLRRRGVAAEPLAATRQLELALA